MDAGREEAQQCLLGNDALGPRSDLLAEVRCSYLKHGAAAFPVQYTQ